MAESVLAILTVEEVFVQQGSCIPVPIHLTDLTQCVLDAIKPVDAADLIALVHYIATNWYLFLF